MGRSTALLFLLAMALHSYDALAQSAGELTPPSTPGELTPPSTDTTKPLTSLRGKLTDEELAQRLGFYFVASIPFVVYGLLTTGTPSLGLLPGINMYEVWNRGTAGMRGLDHADNVYYGGADWF